MQEFLNQIEIDLLSIGKFCKKRARNQSRRDSKEWRFRVDLHAHPHDDRVARPPCILVQVEPTTSQPWRKKITGKSEAE
jgi:hypothetical protein